MRYSLLSLSLGRYFFGSFIISVFLGLGLFFVYQALPGLHYGNKNRGVSSASRCFSLPPKGRVY